LKLGPRQGGSPRDDPDESTPVPRTRLHEDAWRRDEAGPLKLFVTLTSPYVRVVRMAIMELGMTDRVEVIAVRTRVPDGEVNAFNPTGKVPTLMTADGYFLAESRLICQYLDALHTDDPIVDHDPAEADRQLEGVTTGFLDGIAVWVREQHRPANEQSPGILVQERARAERCLDWLEARPELHADRLDYPRLCLFAALDALAGRLPFAAWQQRTPLLARWYARVAQRPSALHTRAPDR
jgi:glutathione S-transferase